MSKAHGPLADRPINPKVGLEISHESAGLHVTGKALYTQDLVNRTKDTLHAWPVQAPHAHAMVTGLRVEAAYEVPGVVRVLTADDVPGPERRRREARRTAVPQRGDVLRARRLLGARRDAGGRAAGRRRRSQVDYQPLPSLVTIQDAIAADSFQGHARTVSRGDADAAMDTAAHRFSGEFEFGGQEHFYLETNAALALVDENGQIFVQSSTQHPSETQDIVAHVLGIQAHQITVQCLRMGGGFGGKEFQPHGLAAIAALGAVLTGRPVSLRLNRTQDITMTGKRHPFLASWEVGFDDDNRICALRATLTSNGGWSLDLSEPVLARALCHIDNAYWIPDITVHGRIAKTNRGSNTAFRGFGGPQGMIVIEDILGRCAPLLGVDAGRTAAQQLLRTRPGHPVRAAGAARRAARRHLVDPDRAQRLPAAQGRDRRVQRTRTRTPNAALAMTPVKFGISFNLTAFNQAGALVHVYKDGSVLINHGGAEMGQGLHTKMIQVAATALGRAAELRPAGPDPDRQGAQHLGHRGQLGRRPQRRRDQERLRPDPGAAERRRRRQARHPPRRRPVRRRHGHRDRLPRPADRLGEPGARRVLPAGAAVGGRLLPDRRAALGRQPDAGRAVQVLRLRRRAAPRSRSTASPAPTGCGGSTSCTTSATACRR